MIKQSIAIFLLTLAVPIVAASSHVSVIRTLPTNVSANSTFSVTLAMDVNETNSPNGVIIKESVPLGWNITNSSPTGYFNYTSGLIKWVFFGSGVADQSITYTVEVPSNTSGTKTFTGQVSTINSTASITGDSEVAVDSPPTITTFNVPTSVMLGGNATITINVSDDIGVISIILTVNGTTITGTGGVYIYTPTAIGGYTANVTVSDAIGNVVSQEKTFTVSIPGDTNYSGCIDDVELLTYIEQWANGEVSTTYLLTTINAWAKC